MRIYKTTDKVNFKVGDAMFTIVPLSRLQKMDILSISSRKESGLAIDSGMEMTALSMKYSIKDVQGLKDGDGDEYKVLFDDQGYLTEQSVDDLFNIEEALPLMTAMASLTSGIGKLNSIQGVEIVGGGIEKK